MKKVLTIGVFDLLHMGHVELFRKAKALGDYLIVAVQNSEMVEKYKPGAHLVCSTEERCYMVGAIRWVDEVVTYNSSDEIVGLLDFDILAKGPDQNNEAFQRALKIAEERGIEVVTLPRTEGISSTDLKSRAAK